MSKYVAASKARNSRRAPGRGLWRTPVPVLKLNANDVSNTVPGFFLS